MKRCVVLSSGGMDSATVMAIAKSEGYEIYSISFDYGQRHKVELERAVVQAKYFGAKKHIIVGVDLRQIGGSALTDDGISVPKNRKISKGEIPVTYVPARNVIFLSIALGYAETSGANEIFIGANAIDYSGYPDCRPDFIKAFEDMANIALKSTVSGGKLKIKAPLINMTKGEIIKKGLSLGLDYSITFSCYDPVNEGVACGKCDSCALRLKGFKEANAIDPIKYAI